jgi:hypothetical protein
MDLLGQFPATSDSTLSPLQEAVIKFMQILVREEEEKREIRERKKKKRKRERETEKEGR